MVVGSRGLGAIRRELLGSVSTAVTRHAYCPVAIVHSTSATDAVSSEKPVLVGVDGTSRDQPAHNSPSGPEAAPPRRRVLAPC
ncbi:universal stress protein [Nocardia rhizosphaerihabitans]|uniref:universal stress protein n=1 Tax=Nocardia rhizosphaerihabitans TaxID=1691570 RepID=UPI00227B8ACB|nr:universal stress protein [Nocardia rhizosphaerihabitans]